VEVKAREVICHVARAEAGSDSPGGSLYKRQLIAMVGAVLSLAIFAGCGSDEASSRDRASSAIEECRGHGGVGAFEDDVVICRDQTANENRGSRAVEACRGHGGVVAFDDDIVFCRDQTFHEAEER
jgi:hypothetical protein